MKTTLQLAACGCALTLCGPAAMQAATASYPTPIDNNPANGMIDAAEINTAIAANSGVVFLPANRTYNINIPIQLNKNGVSLVGEGPTTVLPIVGNIEGIVVSGGIFGGGVRHLKITGPAGHTQNAIRIDTCNETFVEDVTIANTGRGIELVNGIGPLLTGITMTGLKNDYGIKVDGGTKVDAVQLYDIAGSASAATVEWLLLGRADGVEIQDANLSGGKRGIRCFGTTGPKYVYTNDVTIAGCTDEGIRVETGNDLLINATTINNTGGSAFTFASGFTGGAVITDLNVTGAAGHGVQIDGGRDIGILEPTINATGSALPAGTGAGIKIAAGCLYVSVTDGSSTGQTYGVLYSGTAAQSDTNNVKIKNVSLSGNSVPVSPANLEGAPIIKDNTDASGITLTGAWTATTASPGYYGSNYLHDGSTGGTGGKKVKFTPTITSTGNYDVYVRWTAAGNRATNAPIDVTYASGTSTFTVNQQANNGTWVLLGTFAFNAGTTGNVTVRNDGANGYVVADAAMFILK